jgi:hypothetical protein
MILCLHCATIIEDNSVECPACGESVNLRVYNRILEKIDQYILFGYHYRQKYEEQYAEAGKIETKYAIELSNELFSWIGLAVLSGIIGGASWDFVKFISKKIASQVKDDDLSELVSSDESLKQFSDYLLDYHNSFRGITGEIQDAIFEEMRAHAAEDMDAHLDFDLENKDELMNYLKKNSKKAGEKFRSSKVSVSIVKSLWGKTKVSIEIKREDYTKDTNS